MEDKYIQDNDITETLRDRGKGKIKEDLEHLFVEPSKAFPSGWNSGTETGGFLDKSHLSDNLTMTIYPCRCYI